LSNICILINCAEISERVAEDNIWIHVRSNRRMEIIEEWGDGGLIIYTRNKIVELSDKGR
jgi:hypothetical protein